VNNKVLLVNTSFRGNRQSAYSTFGPPMGLLAIASSLKTHGYSVQLIDPQIDPDYLNNLESALEKKQLFIGMSTYLGENIKHAVEMSRMIKRKTPETPLVLGGPLASSIPAVFLRQMPVNFIVMGPGEATVVRLADALRTSTEPRSLSHISYMDKDEVTIGEMPLFEGNLDDLPQPDLELWQQGISHMNSIPIITSRGCRRGCSFCYNTFNGRRAYFLRSPENVIGEMERWSRRFNISKFQFFDDNFLLDSTRALTILHEMARRKWRVERLFGHLNEFDGVAPEQLSGVADLVVMCIESASPRIQKILNKRLDLEKALAVIKRITDQKIHFITAFMFGLPSETDDDIRLSIECAEKIRRISDNTISMCYIYAPQPKDAIVGSLSEGQHIEFSLDAVSEVEVVPVPPDNKIDLRLRPWMTFADKQFYLDLVQVWQYHFAHRDHPSLDLGYIYSRNERVRNLFRNVSLPRYLSNVSKRRASFTSLKARFRCIMDRLK
jgi:anaerobic magnesium-protoporphyrin IX monomethyl ester cyclase